MSYYILKILITAILVVVISEVSRRNSFLGAIFASIPLISVLAMLWLYVDTKNVILISNLSKNIFWLVLPSLTLFVALPLLLDHGVNFYFSMALSIAITVGCYFGTVYLLTMAGIKL